MRKNRFLCTAILLLASSSIAVAEPAAGGASSKARGRADARGWAIEESENFRICRAAGCRVQPGLTERLETLRKELCDAWLSGDAAAWQPKCYIVLHATGASYVQEVGAGGRQTSGSSLVDVGGQRVVARRIDIRGDCADWLTGTLPHELTHVILADRFVESPIPRWADEGVAMLADTAEKRRRHEKDLRAALGAGNDFRLAELLTMESYPHPSRMGAFYAQSVSLAEYMTRIGTKSQFVAFVDKAASQGYDAALRETYAIAGVSDLERRWRKHLVKPYKAETVDAQRTPVPTTDTASASAVAAAKAPPAKPWLTSTISAAAQTE
ncbi:MAG: hypothetical protein HYX69_04230 [Planctomycetia bacterium]|nr:hypothetical protein [Planctomycetia bacterium]